MIQRTTRSPTTPMGAGAPRSSRASTRARPSAVATTTPARETTPAAPSASIGRASSAAARPASPLRSGNVPTAATGTKGPVTARGEGVGPAGTTATAAVIARRARRRGSGPIASRCTGTQRLAVPGRATRRAGTRDSRARERQRGADGPDPGSERDPRPHGAARAPLHQGPPGAGDRRETRNRRRPPGRDGEPAEPEAGEHGCHHRDARRHRDHNGPRSGHLDARPHVRRQLRHRSGHDASTPHFVRGGRPAPDQRTGSPPSSTAPRSARHHGSSIAAAATAASPAGSAIPAQERGGAGWVIVGSSRDRQSASRATRRGTGTSTSGLPWAISVPPPSTAVEHRSTARGA